MSGHSKWSQIKRQKGVADIKRGQTFTKLSNAISVAVREGGGIGEAAQNFRLRLEIEKARAVNMPKENIERAIEKGKGALAGGGLEESIYEGFGEGGKVAFIVEAVTDNKNRTAPEIRNVFEKSGYTVASPGAVSYQFAKRGFIIVKKNDKTIDDVFLIAADAGADDLEDVENEIFVYTKPEELTKVKDALISAGLEVTACEFIKIPLTPVEISDQEILDKVAAFIDRLESLDDVQKVYTNISLKNKTFL